MRAGVGRRGDEDELAGRARARSRRRWRPRGRPPRRRRRRRAAARARRRPRRPRGEQAPRRRRRARRPAPSACAAAASAPPRRRGRPRAASVSAPSAASASASSGRAGPASATRRPSRQAVQLQDAVARRRTLATALAATSGPAPRFATSMPRLLLLAHPRLLVLVPAAAEARVVVVATGDGARHADRGRHEPGRRADRRRRALARRRRRARRLARVRGGGQPRSWRSTSARGTVAGAPSAARRGHARWRSPPTARGCSPAGAARSTSSTPPRCAAIGAIAHGRAGGRRSPRRPDGTRALVVLGRKQVGVLDLVGAAPRAPRQARAPRRRRLRAADRRGSRQRTTRRRAG